MSETMRAILHTGRKTDEELLKDGGMVSEKDLPWMRAVAAAWDGAEVYVRKEGANYNLVGWEEHDCLIDEKVKEAIWKMEQDPVVGTYGSREEFEADWRDGQYEPAAGISFSENDVELLKEESNRQKLARLITRHPELPIVCMVESEIVADDFCTRWMASVGDCHVTEYTLSEYGANEGERVWERWDAGDLVDVMAEDAEERPTFFNSSGDPMENLSREEKYKLARQQAWEKVNEMEWKRAIFLNIDMPEEE